MSRGAATIPGGRRPSNLTSRPDSRSATDNAAGEQLMRNRSRRSRRLQTWLPGLGLALTAILALLAFAQLDASRSDKYGSLRRLLLPDASGAAWTMSLVGTSEGVAIAIVIVVVVLGVQLTADRYSPRIIDIFVRDPVNGGVLALFLGSIVFTIGVSAEIKTDYVPEIGVLVDQ